jgi:hypothetical protein
MCLNVALQATPKHVFSNIVKVCIIKDNGRILFKGVHQTYDAKEIWEKKSTLNKKKPITMNVHWRTNMSKPSSHCCLGFECMENELDRKHIEDLGMIILKTWVFYQCPLNALLIKTMSSKCTKVKLKKMENEALIFIINNMNFCATSFIPFH